MGSQPPVPVPVPEAETHLLTTTPTSKIPAAATVPAVRTIPAAATVPAARTIPAAATVPAARTIPAAATVPSVRTIPAAPTIPVPRLPKNKPPLVCHMMSPQYTTDDTEKEKIMNAAVPSPGLCDYIVFDIPQEVDGKYDRAAYEFLGRHGNLSKYMFTVNVYDPILASLRKTLAKTTLTDTAREVLQTVPLRGFGILGEMSQLNASAFDAYTLLNDAGLLKLVYADDDSFG
ncbi:uncharacterized protein LOC142558479 [Dermacentor variabilis]|uniref:uncharacterized protein LOC142558479 n=1 Tax=Dermacentor variabilis TaxID=34621 RepID=UPI003F5C04A5